MLHLGNVTIVGGQLLQEVRFDPNVVGQKSAPSKPHLICACSDEQCFVYVIFVLNRMRLCLDFAEGELSKLRLVEDHQPMK
jgi:hypothetical protein